MSTLRILPVLIATACLLAGCADHSPDRTSPEASTTSTGASEPSANVPPGNESAVLPSFLSLNDCIGMETSVPYANAVGEFPTPPGWEAGPTQDGIYVLKANICQRISVGPFERGPIALVQEGHRHTQPPTACQDFEPDYDGLTILMNLWVDDPELAVYLRETLGLPASMATIERAVTEQGGVQLQTWSWQPVDAGRASILRTGDPGGDRGINPFTERLVWVAGTGVSMLDLTEDVILPQTTPFVLTEGELAPPTWWATQGPSTYAGPLSVWSDGDNTGPIYRFGDLQCEQSLP